MTYREKLYCCMDVADEMRPLVVALTDLDYPDESKVYVELMYSLALRCEEYLGYYYNKSKENMR